MSFCMKSFFLSILLSLTQKILVKKNRFMDKKRKEDSVSVAKNDKNRDNRLHKSLILKVRFLKYYLGKGVWKNNFSSPQRKRQNSA